ncbi:MULTISPECIES: DUF3558 domain-containing protein [unclassified Streptomyces]|uniref:DUF3558 domain-containing protein n=1 Tax=unclassified Streptomyces TaxID=2593676 RepID=UPI000DB8F8CB|nr:DUF3558 domain-containing protein [Streptomyces sp. PsTaAH-137]MYT72073.1 DUF3558 domain-containing protein [Streptomyces sp. SID8367]RAJ81484.1 hypothetical protein K377_04502 [Streptomyces sp. PsTaAH-137]
MQRKSYAYVPGVAVLLTALLAGCSGSTADDGATDDSKPGDPSVSATAAKPGKYRTLPEPCGQPEQSMLDTMLPGIAKIADEDQRDRAYEGVATTTFDTGRRVGCRWKDDSAAGGAHRLTLDFERVVSYDSAVSDDSSAEQVFADEAEKADLADPGTVTDTAEPGGAESSSSPSSSTSKAAKTGKSGKSSESPESPGSGSPSDSTSPADLRPRLLDGLGDQAFLNDEQAGPTASPTRTVTVVFRTSNVVVTVAYEAQPAASGDAPDSKEMQDRTQELAQKLVGKFGE